MAPTLNPDTDSTGYLAVLQNNKDFRLLWTGEVVSLFGDWFNLIGSAALIAQLTDSGLAVSGLFIVRMLAPFLISPLAGVFADRYNRKGILIISDLARATVVLGFLLVHRPEDVWLLYVLTVAQLAISGLFFPARNAILPDIVTSHQLGAANALSSSTWSVMLALGAAMGGLVVGQWGIYPAFVVDALTFLVSASFIWRVRYTWKDELDASGRSIGSAVTQYLDGLRYLKQHTYTLAIALHKGALALAVNGAFQIIQVALAEQVYVVGEGGGTSLGILYAVTGIGTGIGPILVRRFTGDNPRSLRTALLISYSLGALGMALIAPLASFGMVLAGSFIRALAGGVNWVFSTQLLMQVLPDRVRGRVFSTEFAFMTLANALGAAGGGWLLDSAGINLPGLIGLTAIAGLVPGVLWGLWIWQKPSPVGLKNLP